MKKYLLLLINIPVFILSQNLGINTDSPTAKLEIKTNSKSEHKVALQISNNTGDTLMNVDDSGNIFFNESLKANNNSGTTDYVLSSKGVNKSPVWVDIKETILGRWVVVAYNAFQNTSLLTNFIANDNVRINMHTARFDSSSIGVWDSTNREYTVKKSGVYDVTINVRVSANNENDQRSSTMFLQIGNYKQGTKGKKQFDNKKTIHLTTKATRYLTQGEKIYVFLNSNYDGQFDEATININYSEKI